MVDMSEIAKLKFTNIHGEISTSPTGRLNQIDNTKIGKLLGAFRQSIEQNEEIVSRRKTTFQNQEGMLIQFSDGTLAFETIKEENGKKFKYTYTFNNENDFKKETPQAKTVAKAVKNGKETEYKTQCIESYKYHSNGKISHSELHDVKGNLLNKAEYNKNGKIASKTTFNKKGEIQAQYKYTYPDKNTQHIEQFDKDNKLKRTSDIKWNGDKKVSSEVKYPSGNTELLTNYDSNGKMITQKAFWENGKLKSETTFYPETGAVKTQKVYDENGNIKSEVTPEIDGHFGNSAQKSEGDCYLMASINAIRQTENGQQVLKNLIKISRNAKGEKVYTVTLPGAKIAAEGLKKDSRIAPGTVAITGTYTFTESEMQDILKYAGQKYSVGDGDVILLEAAFEKYRKEVKATLDANGIKQNEVGMGEAGLQTGNDEDNILANGRPEDAMFILTGKTSSVYENRTTPNGLDYDSLREGKITVRPIRQNTIAASTNIKAVQEIDGKVSKDKQELNKTLDKIMNEQKTGKIKHSAVAGFKVVHSDGSVGGHALTIKSVDATTVTLINPWNPEQEVTMSREDFLNSVSTVSFTESVTEDNNSNHNGNSNGKINDEKLREIINRIIRNKPGYGSGSTRISGKLPKDKITEAAQQFTQATQNAPSRRLNNEQLRAIIRKSLNRAQS